MSTIFERDMMEPHFDTMTEADVREIIVRPLLTRLGFKHGTEANVRTEVTLSYDRAFLGRKNPKKDPPLTGRADYICEVIGYGRWTVEVKAPSVVLSQDDVEQAHTYSAHPQIAATHFMVTNGREFKLYVTAQLGAPIMTWSYSELDEQMMKLFNIVGPSAIKKRFERSKADPHKPLGEGLPSQLRIVGGDVNYGPHHSDHPLFATDALNNMVGAVTGGYVRRADDGRLSALIGIRSPHQGLAELNRAAGLGDFLFFSSDEYVSIDPANPTVFQNVVEGQLAPGQTATLYPGMPPIPIPFGFKFVIFTEAVGYFENDTFVGSLTFEYDYQIIRGRPCGIPPLDKLVANSPPTAHLSGVGTFSITIAAP